jgi:hypothetical protein
VTKAPPDEPIQVSAPPLVGLDPFVEALAPASYRSLTPTRARRLAQRAALEILIPSCDDDPKGRGFGIDAHTVVAHRDVIEGGGWVRVFATNGRSTAVGPGSAYRLGELGVVRVSRALPRRLVPARTVAAGTSVVVVAERNDKLRMLPGIVVDSVPGARYGVAGKVLRVTSAVRDDDAGPVIDAKGRVVGVVFAYDERTTLGLALPVSALRGRAVTRSLEARDAC